LLSSIVILGGIALYVVELKVDEPSITNLEDAFWLTITTMTTVGYGEISPQTTKGRIVASLLLFAGILTFFGFLSTIASKIIKPALEVKAKKQEEKEKSKEEDEIIDNDYNKKKENIAKYNQQKNNKAKKWIKEQIKNY
jgi:voltage-gated potassium channel